MKKIGQNYVTVIKSNVNIDVDVNDTVVIGENITINGTLTDENGTPIPNATVIVTDGNTTKNVTTDDEGKFNTTITPTNPGDKNITVTYPDDDNHNGDKTEENVTVTKLNTEITLNVPEIIIVNRNTTISGVLYDENGKIIANKPITVLVENKKYETTTDAEGKYEVTIVVSRTGTLEIGAMFDGDEIYMPSENYTDIASRYASDDEKTKTEIIVTPVTGHLGETITLNATIRDENGNLVDGGRVVFKFNGATIKEGIQFTKDGKPLLIEVHNGIAQLTFEASKYMQGAKTLTATYSGNDFFASSRANIADVDIKLREASITASVNQTNATQDKNITFIANVEDITDDQVDKSRINDGFVIFKVNGKTLRDANGEAIKVKVVNGVAKYSYYVEKGMAGILGGNEHTFDPRYYTVTAKYINNEYNTAVDDTEFTVAREQIKINFINTTIDMENKKLSIKANITTNDGEFVKNTNKYCVKVNGITLKDDEGNTLYFNAVNGQIDLKDLNIKENSVRNITIVTGDRLAYMGANATTEFVPQKD